MELVKSEYPGFDIHNLVDVLRTQESFLELSKYLLSDVAYSYDMPDAPTDIEVIRYPNPMSTEAFDLIRRNIENRDLQKIMSPDEGYKNKEVLQQVYDWMQKNYSKYKIKKIW